MRKKVRLVSFGILFIVASAGAMAQDKVIAKAGDIQLTAKELRDEIEYLRSAKDIPLDPTAPILYSLVRQLLLSKLVKAEALSMGLEKDPKVVYELQRQRSKVLVQARMALEGGSLSESEQEMLAKEYYLTHKDEFKPDDQRRLSHILIRTQDRSDEEAQALARELLKKLNADPTQFAELAKAQSEDPGSKAKSGDLGWVKKSSLVPEFRKVAFALAEKGQISELVKSRFGYHIIRLYDRIEAQYMPFETVKKKLMAQELAAYRKSTRAEYLAEKRQSTVDMIDEDALVEFYRWMVNGYEPVATAD